MQTLTIIGRRWHQRTYGNTYHSVQVIADGETVGRVPFAYGYGDAYEQSAAELLYDKGLLPKPPHGEPLSLHARNLGIAYSRSVSDVARKGDL